jgi:hypothetical protein
MFQACPVLPAESGRGVRPAEERHAVVSYFSSIVDKHDAIRLGVYPGAFRERLGIRVDECARRRTARREGRRNEPRRMGPPASATSDRFATTSSWTA